jgi:hypothetical protein
MAANPDKTNDQIIAEKKIFAEFKGNILPLSILAAT